MINSSVTQLLLFYTSGHNIFYLTTCTHSCFLVTINIMHGFVKKKNQPTFTERRTTDIYTHIYMKNRQFDSLVWGSLTLAPITYGK